MKGWNVVVTVAENCFFFQTDEAFEEKAKQGMRSFLSQLARRSFHTRMHRRDFYGKIKSQDEVGLLNDYLDELLSSKDAAGGVTFDNVT